MNQSQLLADEILRTVTGPMWHGPALAEVLRGVTAEQAARRPIPEAHTIWEIALHITAWTEIALARLGGSPRTSITAAEDWPPVPTPTDDAWTAAVSALERGHRSLAAAVAETPESRLDQPVAGHEYSVRTLLAGVVEHGTYHGGQIALLRKLAMA